MLFNEGELVLSKSIAESLKLIAPHFILVGLCQLHAKHSLYHSYYLLYTEGTCYNRSSQLTELVDTRP